jgi:hypothetical protein
MDLSTWITGEVTAMESMFNTCMSLITIDARNMVTTKVTRTINMFNGTSSLVSIDMRSARFENATLRGAPANYLNMFNSSRINSAGGEMIVGDAGAVTFITGLTAHPFSVIT